ncbi:MAG: hypothetical protein LAN37_09640 [Acidobacteriia bacterium]|nr:hypothetical protein [Terriglobia bacterium]
MKRSERFLYAALLLIGVAALVVFVKTSLDKFDPPGFYALLTFLGTILLVYVTARYVFVFEKDATTRQSVQEEWEARRFYAGRVFAVADGFVDLFFAAKRELEVLIGEWKALEERRQQRKASAVGSLGGMATAFPETPQAIDAEINSRIEVALVRYNERAKDYNWRAQALLEQATTLITPEQWRDAHQIFLRLSADFRGLGEAVNVLEAYSDAHESFSGLVASVRANADSKLRVRQMVRN